MRPIWSVDPTRCGGFVLLSTPPRHVRSTKFQIRSSTISSLASHHDQGLSNRLSDQSNSIDFNESAADPELLARPRYKAPLISVECTPLCPNPVLCLLGFDRRAGGLSLFWGIDGLYFLHCNASKLNPTIMNPTHDPTFEGAAPESSDDSAPLSYPSMTPTPPEYGSPQLSSPQVGSPQLGSPPIPSSQFGTLPFPSSQFGSSILGAPQNRFRLLHRGRRWRNDRKVELSLAR